MSYYSLEELQSLGFKSIGKNVMLSKKASFYNCENIEIGNNVRIDDFCVLSAGKGGIIIGNYIHVAVYSSIIGAGKVVLEDFSNISSKVAIYSSNDDYSGEFLTNPMVSEEFTNVSYGEVYIGKHVIIGAGSIILPNVNLSEGVAIGALSLVNKSCESFSIYVGNPLRKIKDRKRDLLVLETDFLTSRD